MSSGSDSSAPASDSPADPGSTSPLALARAVAAVARKRQISVTAAGLAYHAFNTLVPLVILLLVGMTLVDALEPLLEMIEEAAGLEGMLTSDASEVAGDAGVDLARAGVLALAILLWSAARLFQAVNSAFTGIYGSRKDQSYVGSAMTVTIVTALNTALLTVTVALGVALVSVVGVSVSVFVGGVAATLISSIVLLGLLTVLFFPMYYLFPQADVSAREVLPGTAFAALSWTVLALGFRLYVATSESVALFGIAGAVLLILTWVYFGGFCLLLGAILNAVRAGRVDPDEEWEPVQDAVPTDV
ncbi:ribonuclease BN [Natrialba hulunbeirensis JCM 10989]|uniref:Ribonuclease BN n=1 Tax=Natrialba hulunbeirensis JCM 10989 TaxID=1227493 RepID=M0A5C5_9EURY|nr:YihY/virulence factor BrkB family protein [Natrialba hulunbeirensis]ELY93950.1 ribonuclease BN [Natrialba hulunbeirensis JCM 10989]